MPPPSSRKPRYNTALKYAGLGAEMLAMLGIATFGGYKLDGWCAWGFPLFIIIFPLLALVVFLWRLIKATVRNDR